MEPTHPRCFVFTQAVFSSKSQKSNLSSKPATLPAKSI